MLPKKLRLPIGDRLGERGRTFRSPLFSLKKMPSSLPYARFGVVVGKKAEKTAAGRNALRRKFFDALAPLVSSLPPADYLIMAFPASVAVSREKLHDELISLSAS